MTRTSDLHSCFPNSVTFYSVDSYEGNHNGCRTLKCNLKWILHFFIRSGVGDTSYAQNGTTFDLVLECLVCDMNLILVVQSDIFFVTCLLTKENKYGSICFSIEYQYLLCLIFPKMACHTSNRTSCRYKYCFIYGIFCNRSVILAF